MAKMLKSKKVVTKAKVNVRKVVVKPKKVSSVVKDQFTKTEILSSISDATELSKSQVAAVLDELGNVIERHIKKGAVGKFKLPGLLNIEVKHKPAVKARKGLNPFTGQETMFKAKPARNVVKVKALKKLKDMVA